MSVFDPILRHVLGGSSNAGPMQSVLGALLGGDQRQQPQQSPGLFGLINQFRGAGLGGLIDSWISTGPNQPVSPQQVQDALGQERVEQLSQQTGLPTSGILAGLAQYLPNLVDVLTPGGQVPPPGQVPPAPSSSPSSGNPFDDAGIELPPRR